MQDRKWLQCPYLLGLQPLSILSTVKDGIIASCQLLVNEIFAKLFKLKTSFPKANTAGFLLRRYQSFLQIQLYILQSPHKMTVDRFSLSTVIPLLP